MTDEIMQQIWQAKDELAKKFNYDLDTLAVNLQQRQEDSGREVVDLRTDAERPVRVSQ